MPSRERDSLPACRLPPKYVECKGPRKKVHSFWNDGTSSNRTCPECRRMQDQMRLSPRYLATTADPE